MSKKTKKTKAAKETLSGLSKKGRKALETREAELAAELERRKKADKKADRDDLKGAKKAVKKSEKSNAKAAKKSAAKASKKKGKGKSKPAVDFVALAATMDAPADSLGDITIGAEAPLPPEPAQPEPVAEDAGDDIPAIGHTPDEIRTAARKVLDDPNATPGARDKAEKALETADLKEKVQRKRAERDAEAGAGANVKAARTPDAAEGETEAEYQMRKLREKKERKAVKAAGAAVDAIRQATEALETETGRVFSTGEAVAADEPESFAKPSDAAPELEEGRNGYKIIQLDADGKPDPRKVRQMTRVTTFVGNIDDETTLKKWDKRMVVEGISTDAVLAASDGSRGVPLVAQVNDITHRRDAKIAKARRADRKGKLGIGEVGRLVAEAEKEARDALDAIVEEAAALAGRNDKANFGTHLHTLAEIVDEKGIDEVRRLHESDELVAHDNDGKDGLEPMPVTATDVATMEAYDERMRRLNVKILHSEFVVVNDEMGYAGRGDRIVMAKLPELTMSDGTKRPADQRARRYVADLKSGSVDFSAGKIARQLAAYAIGDLYDLETGERSKHSAVRDVGLVIHIPQGEGVCTVHAVDLKAGLALLKLSAEVRRARNTGRKTINISVDIADPAPGDEPTE